MPEPINTILDGSNRSPTEIVPVQSRSELDFTQSPADFNEALQQSSAGFDKVIETAARLEASVDRLAESMDRLEAAVDGLAGSVDDLSRAVVDKLCAPEPEKPMSTRMLDDMTACLDALEISAKEVPRRTANLINAAFLPYLVIPAPQNRSDDQDFDMRLAMMDVAPVTRYFGTP